MSIQHLLKLYPLNSDILHYVITPPYRGTYFLWVVEILNSQDVVIVTGCAANPENAFIDAKENLEELNERETNQAKTA